MKNIKIEFLIFIIGFLVVQTLAEKVESGKNEAESSSENNKDTFEIDDLQKRYRLHGKREKLDDDDTSSELTKRYRLYGKRLMDMDASELEKRYRLYGKRYRLYGKRYRLYGKRADDSSESNENDLEKTIMKRYRLMGKDDTHKRYRLYDGRR